LNSTYNPKEDPWALDFHRTNNYLRDIIRGERDGENFAILYSGYNAHTQFYVNILNEKGKHISLRNYKDVIVGETVLTSQDEASDFV
jgi:hypothetical protein